MDGSYIQLFDQIVKVYASREDLDGFQRAVAESGKLTPFERAYSSPGKHSAEDINRLMALDVERVRGAKYPTTKCLRPHHVQEYVKSKKLKGQAKAHVDKCAACASLLAGIQVNERKFSDFLEMVRMGSTQRNARNASPSLPSSNVLDSFDVMHVIGRALSDVAKSLQDRPDRRSLFRSVLKHADAFYPTEDWGYHVLVAADECGFPGWAVECLPKLYHSFSDTGNHALVWHYVTACIPMAYRFNVLNELCEGVVYEVAVDNSVGALLGTLAPLFETSRLGNPYPSDQSMRAIALQVMARRSSEMQGEEAHALEEARENILRSPALLPNYDGIITAVELLAASRGNEDGLLELLDPLRTLYREELPKLARVAEARGKQEIAEELKALAD